jgi:hypothetical protein
MQTNFKGLFHAFKNSNANIYKIYLQEIYNNIESMFCDQKKNPHIDGFIVIYLSSKQTFYKQQNMFQIRFL